MGCIYFFFLIIFLNPDSVFVLIDAIESSYREIFYQWSGFVSAKIIYESKTM